MREYFIMIQGILNYSDWLASGNSAAIIITTTTTIGNPNLFTMGYDFLPNPYHYQLKAKEVSGNILITLPTGSGKTETAIMWIMENYSPSSRIFYTLPTRPSLMPCIRD